LFPKTTGAYDLNDVSLQSLHLFRYHKSETTPHPYSSKWYTWPIALKPMLYVYETNTHKAIYLMGNYAIAYVSIIGLVITAYMAYKKRDPINSVIIGAWLGLWLPYALIGRTMFLYHYLPASIFAILALVNMFYQVPKIRVILPYYLAAVLISFIIIYPNLVGV
jgi:dolichyl-phosphate-mannose--protein O-mannosyl transferase